MTDQPYDPLNPNPLQDLPPGYQFPNYTTRAQDIAAERAAEDAATDSDSAQAPEPLAPDGAGNAMLAPHSSGLDTGPIDQVRMDMDALRDFANRHLAGVHEDAERLLREFTDLSPQRQMFSNAHEPVYLCDQIVAVHEIIAASLRGAVADIDRFRGNILKSVEGQARADDAAAEALNRAIRKFTKAGLEGERAFAASVQAHTDGGSGPPPAGPHPEQGSGSASGDAGTEEMT